MVKNLPTTMRETRVQSPGSIPGLRICLGEGNGYHSSIFAGRIPRTGSLAGYSLWDHKELDMTD